MRQWKSLVALHASAPSCFPQPPSRELEQETEEELEEYGDEKRSPPRRRPEQEEVVRLVGCDGRVRAYRPPLTARELMQQHPRHLVCRADALLIGEKIPAVAPAEELRPGQAYFLLPAHLFRSVLSFVSLASSLLLLLSAAAGGKQQQQQQRRPFELHRTASGTLQIKFSDDFLVGAGDDDESAAEKRKKPQPAVLRGDDRLEKEYEELVGYGRSRRWVPKLEPIQEALNTEAPSLPAAPNAEGAPASSSSSARRKSRGLPFLGRLGSRRRRDASSCNGSSAVACSG